jgi:YD repeat-containing protein
VKYDWQERLAEYQGTVTGQPTFGGPTKWTYDIADRLLEETFQDTPTFTHETGTNFTPRGNIKHFPNATPPSGNFPVQYNRVDQHIGFDQSTPLASYFKFDSNGNPTTYKGAACLYDPEDHLTELWPGRTDPPTDPATTPPQLAAAYRADGLLAWKETGPAGSRVRTYFIYDGDRMLAEVQKPSATSAAALTAYNVWGANGLLSRETLSGSNYVNTVYQYDPLGNVVQRLDDDGVAKTTERFDAWGNRLACEGDDLQTEDDPL